MVNFQFNLASVSGIILAVGGAGLYAVRSFRPELSRDSDIFFSAVGLLCGLILIFYGWRFDPIMQFGQVLLTGASIYFVVENLRLRRVSTEQAKRNTPIVDTDRPVSNKYRTYNAEIEDYDAIEERVRRPRIQGTRDVRSSRDEYDDRSNRRSSARTRDDRSTPANDRPRKSRPRSEDPVIDATVDSGDSGRFGSSWGDERPARTRPSSRSSNGTPSSSRPRRPRPSDDETARRRDVEAAPSDYVEYRPVEQNDDETDNWGES
jgi:Ycf66 protein N-terminus